MTGSVLPEQKKPSPLVQLRQQMTEAYSLEELRTLCFDLEVNFDELPHLGLTPKICDLIIVMVQNGRPEELLTAVAQGRPTFTWPNLDDLLNASVQELIAEIGTDQGDIVGGDKLTVGNISDDSVAAAGAGATAVGPRAVTVVGDVKGDIHTGDVNNYYLGTDKEPVPFADITALQEAILQCGSLLRQHKHTFADTELHIDREVVDQIVEWLLTEDNIDKNVAMLLDQAGMGKTVVMRSVLHKLEAQGIDVLAIKADQQLSDITVLSEIQHKLALPHPAEQIISRLAQLNRVVVLIDQIDALSLSLAHDQLTLNTTLDFVARLRRIPNVRILLSCRIFDRNTDPRLNRIELGQSFPLKPLSGEQIKEVLVDLQVDEQILSQATHDLLCVPLHLDLFARAVANESSLEQLRGIASLQELYALIWQNVVLKQQLGSPPVAERIEVLDRLTHYMNQQQRTSAPQSLLQTAETAHLDRAVNWLASIGILIRGKTEWSFLHQTFFDYCYARQFVQSGSDIVSTILSSKQGLFERPKLIQVITYLRGSDHPQYIRDLQRLLNTPELRYHLHDVLLHWFGSLHNPTDDEWLLAQQMLYDEQKRWKLLSAMHNIASWFNRVKPILESWLSHGNDSQIEQTLSYLTSVIDIIQSDVVSLLNPFINNGDEWFHRITNVLSQIREWQTEDAIKLYETAVYKQPSLDRYNLLQLKSVSMAFPQASCRILRYVFDLALRQHIEKLEEVKKHGSRAFYPSMGLFDELHALEGTIKDTLKNVSESEQKLFIDNMLPWVIQVVSLTPEPNEDLIWYASDEISHNWYDNLFRTQHALVHM